MKLKDITDTLHCHKQAYAFIGATKSVSQPTAVTKKFSFEKRLPTQRRGGVGPYSFCLFSLSTVVGYCAQQCHGHNFSN